MTEYEQLGSWLFWNTYGDTIHYIDGNLIGPSLRIFGVIVDEQDKWPLGVNTYSFFLDYRECEFIFDTTTPGASFEILLRRHEHATTRDIGKLAVESGIPTTQAQQDSFKKSLYRLLEIARH